MQNTASPTCDLECDLRCRRVGGSIFRGVGEDARMGLARAHRGRLPRETRSARERHSTKEFRSRQPRSERCREAPPRQADQRLLLPSGGLRAYPQVPQKRPRAAIALAPAAYRNNKPSERDPTESLVSGDKIPPPHTEHYPRSLAMPQRRHHAPSPARLRPSQEGGANPRANRMRQRQYASPKRYQWNQQKRDLILGENHIRI